MWEAAPGFRPDVAGLTDRTRIALERLAERVRAMGGVLQVTSAHRPGDRFLDGRGAAVDVWVPGWTHTQIREAAAGTGFVAGYVPHGVRRFVELVTEPYWYTIRRGDIFQLPDGNRRAPILVEDAKPEERSAILDWFGRMRERGWNFEDIIDVDEIMGRAGERAREEIREEVREHIQLPEIGAGDITRGVVILVVVVLVMVIFVMLLKSV